MHTASLAWLQCSTGETQLFQYFNTVFLEILNAPLRTVFANPVTYNLKFFQGFLSGHKTLSSKILVLQVHYFAKP